MTDTVKLKVMDGFGVYLDGEAYNGGAVLDVPSDLAVDWLAGGFVQEVPAGKADKPSTKRQATAQPRRK